MKSKASDNGSKGMTVSEAGRIGGLKTLRSQGVEHFKKIGRKGGKRTARKSSRTGTV